MVCMQSRFLCILCLGAFVAICLLKHPFAALCIELPSVQGPFQRCLSLCRLPDSWSLQTVWRTTAQGRVDAYKQTACTWTGVLLYLCRLVVCIHFIYDHRQDACWIRQDTIFIKTACILLSPFGSKQFAIKWNTNAINAWVGPLDSCGIIPW